MKCIHIADLHIGKSVHGFSMLEDQAYILSQLLQLIKEHKADALLVSGDIYDKSQPGADAVALLDWFLTELAALSIQTLLISGNHDSPQRLSFASALLQRAGVHLYGLYDGTIHQLRLKDKWGDVVFHLLPFVRPSFVRPFFPEETIHTHDDAVRVALLVDGLEAGARHVLLAHQFVAGIQEPLRSDSEMISVGGTDAVSFSHMVGYDYVALGHLHGAQQAGCSHIRYCGSPLKYSASECTQEKSATLVSLGKNGLESITPLPLIPLRDMRRIQGELATLTSPDVYAQANQQDYIHAVLTDENAPLFAMDKLRAVYPNIMTLGFDNSATRAQGAAANTPQVEELNPEDLFSDFFFRQNGRNMTQDELAAFRSSLKETEESAQ